MNAIGITRNPKAGTIEIKMTPVAVVAITVLFKEESSLGSFLIDFPIDCPMANRADPLRNFKNSWTISSCNELVSQVCLGQQV